MLRDFRAISWLFLRLGCFENFSTFQLNDESVI
jgi:hypothetical protein